MNIIRPESVTIQQNFRRVEINLANDPNLITLDDGSRIYDVLDFVGDSIYVPPESAPIPIALHFNQLDNSSSSKLPTLWPGGNVSGLYNRFRITVPDIYSAPSGIVVLILSARMGFSSGTVIVNPTSAISPTGNVGYVPQGKAGWLDQVINVGQNPYEFDMFFSEINNGFITDITLDFVDVDGSPTVAEINGWVKIRFPYNANGDLKTFAAFNVSKNIGPQKVVLGNPYVVTPYFGQVHFVCELYNRGVTAQNCAFQIAFNGVGNWLGI